MNKTAIKNFAVWARRKLISEITYKAGLIGITEKAISKPLSMSTDNVQFFDIGTGKPTEISDHEIKQREALVNRIKEKECTSDYKTAFQFVVEEVAYTWFNRMIAIRFMEVNDYLPSRIRVLSSETSGKSEPDMVTTPFDTDMAFSAYEKDRIIQLKHENELDELFRILFIKQCNKLNEVLPELFEKTADYTELLLSISFTDSDGMVSHLVNDITEEDFTEAVEIIGWMYQYYNTEPKDELINARSKYTKDDIPFVTQLFTSDWIVRYIVDNSLGRYWIERNPQSKLKEKLDFFVPPKDGEIQYVNEKVTPNELTFFDPCMGSGHILIYAFDVLMEIYRESGFIERDAAQEIIEKNLFGLDIDNRAYQLAYFAMIMKARSYDRRFLTRTIEPNVIVVEETNNISNFACDCITNDNGQNEIGDYLINVYKNAKEIGSLISVDKHDYKSFIEYLGDCSFSGQLTLESDYWYRVTMPMIKKVAKQAIIMSDKYLIVCTNPPYMNSSYMTPVLKNYIEKDFNDYKADIFSAFIVKCIEYCEINGALGFLTPYVWMFISSYENLRNTILSNTRISNMVQLEYNAFEAACVPVCAFNLINNKVARSGEFIKLSDFKGIEVQAPKTLEAIRDPKCGFRYSNSQDNFSKIPGAPIAYWVSKQIYSAFNNGKLLSAIADVKQGLKTGDNDKFLRLWHEVSAIKFSIFEGEKWYPCNKGGEYRRWYGNNEYVINWENDGHELKNFRHPDGRLKSRPQNLQYMFREGLTYTNISSSKFGIRYSPKGFCFDAAGSMIFTTDENLQYLLGLLSSNTILAFTSILSPTMTFEVGQLASIPFIKKENMEIDGLVNENISMSKNDWDAYETSWDFKTHPLIKYRRSIETKTNDFKKSYSTELSYKAWESFSYNQFNKLKNNEEKINRIFINIYQLEDELTSEIEDKDITIHKANLNLDIKSLISYAVGCMFGRYSLDVDGLVYAGGSWDESSYEAFVPDKDNCIPITDEEYFGDDTVGRFIDFIKCVYGIETLEENLNFIAKALDNKGDTSREIIRNYFIKDFYKDHVKTYQKRPIYWLYDSGKQDGFKALVYMHRYTADTTGIVRVDYLHKMQKIYMSEIDRMKEMAENSNNAREVAQAEKRREKLIKQLKETKEYDEKIAHLALSRIAIDLDDGVKVNYEKVQTGQDGKKLDVLAKI